MARPGPAPGKGSRAAAYAKRNGGTLHYASQKPNQPDPARPNIATGEGSTSRPSSPGGLSGRKNGKDWGDGKGAVHTITIQAHRKNVADKAEARANAPYDLGADSQYGDAKTVHAAVTAAENEKYGQLILSQNQQIAASQHQQTANLPGWYQQYRDALEQARTITNNAYQAAGGANAVSAPAGGSGDPVADQAAQARAALQNSFSDLLKTQGAAANANLADQGANSYLQQLGAVQQEGRNEQNLTARLQQLQQEKGDYGNTVLQGMKHDQLGYRSDIAAADAVAASTGAKLKQQDDQFKTTTQLARDKIKAGDQREQDRLENAVKVARIRSKKTGKALTPTDKLNEAKLEYFHKHGYFPATGPNSSKPKDPDPKNKNSNAVHFALDWYRKNKGHWGDTSSAITQIQALGGVQKTDVPYDIAKIMDHWARNHGKISRDEYKTLRKYGIPESDLIGHVG